MHDGVADLDMDGVGNEDAGPLGRIKSLNAVDQDIVEAACLAGSVHDDQSRFLVLERASNVVNE